MYVIDSKGQLHEGLALNEAEVQIRKQIEELFHRKVCRGSYHYTREDKPCIELAGYFVTNFNLSVRSTDIKALIDQAEHDNMPIAVEAPQELVAVAAPEVADDGPLF